ncbi:hypothetical protein HanXRQr2_Chr16g0751381 [Helianthus annuus]|uniref:Uncharacterized protein n=1 Tax=Helianthus annuus TaxID=4232 RepID=A0A9K3DTQ9_HELAN|nr:hypothetical protein HanXRQr2_Chr16g0751381 [Helianthus annuus]
MDPSWGASQFPFSGFQQTPNAFSQMSQLQQVQQYQALQQIMQRNTFEQLQSQSQPPVQLEDDDEEVVPESPPQELTRKKKKGKGKMVEPETAQKPRAKGRQWTKVEEEALAMAYTKASNCPIETTKRVVVFGRRQRIGLTRLWSMGRLVMSNPSRIGSGG